MSGLGSRDDARVEAEPNANEGTLSVLLIEDNPGDARLIREMLRGAEELSKRVDPGGVAGGSPSVTHETRLEAGRTHLEADDDVVDVVLLDLNLPDSTGLDTLSSVLETTDEAAVVVLTGMRDQEVGVESIERGADDYLVKGEVSDELLIRSIHHAIERNHQERERERRRRQLEAINRLNEISNDVTHLVITTSSRADLEQRVCERLVAEDAYRFAWIGELMRGGDRITPNASAGVEEGYLDAIEITTDGSTAAGPTGQAIDTKEVQFVGDLESDPTFDPWRQEASERGYRSSVAIPIVHEDFLHGVLNVYAAEPHAFSGPETDILVGLGAVVGHAVAAIERKDALVSDSALELEFRLEGMATPLSDLTREDGRIDLDRIRRTDDGLLAYGAVSGVPRETFLETTRRLPWVEDARALTKGDDEYEFELEAVEGISLVEILATHGGRIATATIEGGEFSLVAELPHSVDTRRLIDLLEEEYDGIEYVAQRTATREVEDRPDYDALLERELTEKQREALETAVYAGYFDWPRTSTGEEIAERLGVAPATFAQHLRAAERKFFDAVFDR